MDRVISFEQAKAQYVHRFTMDHIPSWARIPTATGRYYAPQYRSDHEWYANTTFPGEGSLSAKERSCWSSNHSWPVGVWLTRPWTLDDSAAHQKLAPTMKSPIQSCAIYQATDGSWSFVVHWANGTRLVHNTYDSRDEAGRYLEALIKKFDRFF